MFGLGGQPFGSNRFYESGITRGKEGARAKLSLTLARLLCQDVSPVRPVILDLTALCDLEALLAPRLDFILGIFFRLQRRYSDPIRDANKETLATLNERLIW